MIFFEIQIYQYQNKMKFSTRFYHNTLAKSALIKLFSNYQNFKNLLHEMPNFWNLVMGNRSKVHSPSN
jgi:hypothetical protein